MTQPSYEFRDGLLPPPEISEGLQSYQENIEQSLIELPEQVEQELAIFAYNILFNTSKEYKSYGAFKGKAFSNKKSKEKKPDINNLAKNRLSALEVQLKALEKVKYLAENYKEEPENIKSDDDYSDFENEEEEEYEQM